MKILFFTEAFEPPAYLPRIQYFCKYLLQKGHSIDLISEYSDGIKYAPEGTNFYPISYIKSKGNNPIRKIEWAFKTLLSMFFDIKGRYFYRHSKNIWQNNNYDVVLASTCSTFPLTTAAAVAKQKNIPFYADLRDIFEQAPDDLYILSTKASLPLVKKLAITRRKIEVKRRNKALARANGLCTVSPFHVQTLSRYNNNAFLIFNGFDEDRFFPAVQKSEKFTITYFGRVYNRELRDPGPLFEAISKLIDQNKIDADKFVCRWFTDEDSMQVVRSVAAEFKLENILQHHHFIAPEELNAQMAESSILLVLTNSNQTKKRYSGIMTTKFFEAVGSNRPVLCIPDNHDTLAQAIRYAGCGLVSSNVDEIMAYILDKYTQWQTNGYTTGTVSEEKRMQFARKAGAEIFLNMINGKKPDNAGFPPMNHER